MNELVRDLWKARILGSTISADRSDLPTSLEEAYEVQMGLTDLSGFTRCGYKAGATSEEAQHLLGSGGPVLGVLLEPFVYTSPARIEIFSRHEPAVEGEFVFRFARDLPRRTEPYTASEVAAALDAVAGGIEVVGTRFSGGLEGKGLLLTTADAGVNVALVTGPWVDFSGQDLCRYGVTMNLNGKIKGYGDGSRAMGNPMHVLLWIVNQRSQLSVGIKAGNVVTTGTCTGICSVRAGDIACADFGVLGTVIVEFRSF